MAELRYEPPGFVERAMEDEAWREDEIALWRRRGEPRYREFGVTTLQLVSSPGVNVLAAYGSPVSNFESVQVSRDSARPLFDALDELARALSALRRESNL